MGIVTLAVLVFVVLWLWLGAVEWIVFACFVPAAVITYLVLLRFGMNFWQLFLIVIPAEAVVYFSFHIRAKH